MRSRNLKPGFFSNEQLAECSFETRLCFAGLWLLADREGRLEDRPKRIKGELFRFDSVDVEPMLAELERHGFLIRYAVDGGRFLQITNFKKHQTPHYSEKSSAIKAPELQESDTDDACSKPGVSVASRPPDSGTTPGDSRSHPGKQSSSRGGRNPLIPDSLIPDSLIPEASIAAAPPPPARAREENPGETRGLPHVPPPDDPPPDEREATVRQLIGEGDDAPPPEAASPLSTAAGLICRAIKATGFAAVNPSDPRLLALIEQGATEAEFVAAARAALDATPPKGWGWVLARVAGQRADAAAIELAPPTVDPLAWTRDPHEIQRRGPGLVGEPRDGEMYDAYARRVVAAAKRQPWQGQQEHVA